MQKFILTVIVFSLFITPTMAFAFTAQSLDYQRECSKLKYWNNTTESVSVYTGKEENFVLAYGEEVPYINRGSCWESTTSALVDGHHVRVAAATPEQKQRNRDEEQAILRDGVDKEVYRKAQIEEMLGMTLEEFLIQ